MDSVENVLDRFIPETTRGPVEMEQLARLKDDLREILRPFGDVSIDIVHHMNVIIVTVFTKASGQVTRTSRVVS